MTAAYENAQQFAARIKALLPQYLHDQFDQVADIACAADSPMHLIVLGGFSVGKSTLLNMLVGEQRLHVAKEEATSLPTFIEYGPSVSMNLVGDDGTVLPVDEAGFRDATSNAPEGAACATLALPLAWLQGVTLVDLPGLGSVSSVRQQYTAAQVLQADAVLYLLDPRGPSQADIDALRLIAQYGKRVKVVVARWDDVLAAQARGEPVPRLDAWADSITAQTGLRARLTGVSRDGMGRDDVFEFVTRARAELAMIRLRRLQAELRPLLENALGANADMQHACAVQSEEAARELHANLMQRKQELLALKEDLYERQHDDKANALGTAERIVAGQRAQLEQQLSQLATPVDQEQAWEALQTQGCALLRQAVASLATALSEQSGRYGVLALPEGQAERCHLYLPPLALIDTTAFVESAQLAALERAIADKQSSLDKTEQQLGDPLAVDLEAMADVLHEKMRARADVAGQALPRITELVPGNGAAQIGRMVGEIADIGLMFVNPAAAGTKAGSLIAKSAKAVNITLNAKKVASAVKTGVRTVQAVKNGTPTKFMPPQVLDKLGMLEALSLGYWGERIGAALGGAPTEREIIDPEARAEQQRLLAVFDQDIQQAQRELARKQDLLNERQLSGWALAQGKRELVDMQDQVNRLTEQRAQRERQAQAAARDEHQRALQRLAQRAAQGWLLSYEQQANTMMELLIAHVTHYWEAEVEALVATRTAGFEGLLSQIERSPAERGAALAALRTEAESIERCLAELS